MREILFRGKPKNKVDYQRLSHLYPSNCENGFMLGSLDIFYEKYFINLFGICIEVIPETVGQYTGKNDKNGNKIFEGDILKFNDEVWESCYTSCGYEYDSWKVENYGVVGFDEDRAYFDFIKYKFNENSIEADLHENHDIEFADFISELEVIGNIHDNPELLEVSE